jgi:hypothetical protein
MKTKSRVMERKKESAEPAFVRHLPDYGVAGTERRIPNAE